MTKRWWEWSNLTVPVLSWLLQRDFEIWPHFSLSGLVLILYGRWVAMYTAWLVSWACRWLGALGFPRARACLATFHTYTIIALLLRLQRWHDPGAEVRRVEASAREIKEELAELRREEKRARREADAQAQ